MTTFTINRENNISTFSTEEHAAQYPDVERFRSLKDLAELAANWPNSRLVEIWNGLPGVVQVRKFTDRATAVHRIWKAVQQFAESVSNESVIQIAEPAAPEIATAENSETSAAAGKQESTVAQPATHVAPEETGSDNEASPSTEPPRNAPERGGPKEGSKGAIILALLRREGGATLQELMTASGWQKHSIRGFLSGTVGRKMGLKLLSTTNEAKERVYSLQLCFSWSRSPGQRQIQRQVRYDPLQSTVLLAQLSQLPQFLNA